MSARGDGTVKAILLRIERSRPFFIGLLGERYGWIAEDISLAVMAREA